MALGSEFASFVSKFMLPRLVAGLGKAGVEVTVEQLMGMLDLPNVAVAGPAGTKTPVGDICHHEFKRGGTKNAKGSRCSVQCVQGFPVCATHMKCMQDRKEWEGKVYQGKVVHFPALKVATPKQEPAQAQVVAPVVQEQAPAMVAPVRVVIHQTGDAPLIDIGGAQPMSPTAEEKRSARDDDTDSRNGDEDPVSL